jgi:hypothetical protein
MGAAPSSTQIAQSTLAPSGTYGQMAKGFGDYIKDPFDKGFEAFKQAGGEGGIPLETGEAAMKLGSPVASLALSAFEPPMPKPYVDPDTGKWRGPEGQLNLSDRFDTGLRLAAGGTVGNPSVGGGLSDLYNRPEGQNTGPISQDGYGIGRLNNLAGEQSRYQAQTLGYADGGGVVAGEKGMNLDALPTLNVNTGESRVINSGNNSGNNSEMMGVDSPLYRYLGLSVPSTHTAQGVHRGLLGMARGGYLDGAGDGMSDSIPATIEGKQPARLADGEFVIPADVVSHIGNGSSKAGSKRLYAMLDKVRHARTGNKKQGKEIKADKYLPA